MLPVPILTGLWITLANGAIAAVPPELAPEIVCSILPGKPGVFPCP